MTYTQKELPNYIPPAEKLVKPHFQCHTYVFFLLHVSCFPDQIRILVSAERNVRGGMEFVNRGEKNKIRTNRTFVHVDD
jgi:hypothetical protein